MICSLCRDFISNRYAESGSHLVYRLMRLEQWTVMSTRCGRKNTWSFWHPDGEIRRVDRAVLAPCLNHVNSEFLLIHQWCNQSISCRFWVTSVAPKRFQPAVHLSIRTGYDDKCHFEASFQSSGTIYIRTNLEKRESSRLSAEVVEILFDVDQQNVKLFISDLLHLDVTN